MEVSQYAIMEHEKEKIRDGLRERVIEMGVE